MSAGCSSECSSPRHSILVAQNSTASHSERHVRFTIPKFSEHVSFERDFYRSPASNVCRKSKKSGKIPMDEVEMLKHGFRSEHGQCLTSAMDVMVSSSRRNSGLSMLI
ncbi:unnamed protein product [Bursaphelenchus xylophilus]|uniref:(pine wood nematode) hypothetical protein n=1 Tax=Bursaphelenchus xylophilus TaxID=6326 RepID=A0A1I7RLV9_BURXY|nr:unnamed protein product [Bursaphelenchus xylophilus]CAG9106179.1 unnamed protein product [Bursaphelenchus xylophilus]